MSCVSTATALARRGGRTALRGSWAIRAPTSTFVYTTVFAAGLAIDAKAKAARNKQWEKAFSQLAGTTDNQPPVEGANEKEVTADAISLTHGYHGLNFDDLPRDMDWDALQRIVGMELDEDQVLETQEIQSQIRDYANLAWEDLQYDSRFPGAQLLEWPANTGADLVRNNLPPQSLWAPDRMRIIALRRRHTWKKLAMQELSTGILIHDLLFHTNAARFSGPASAGEDFAKLSHQIRNAMSMTPEQGKQARLDILEALENLDKIPVDSQVDDLVNDRIKLDYPAIPCYFQDADGDFYAITDQMNQGIQGLLEEIPHGSDRKEAVAVAKICHNLLVSSASPDLQTFNTLLIGFRRWRRPKLVDRVASSLMVSKIRPNEITCRELLNHYASARRGHADDFSRFITRMRGMNDGLMLANPSISVNEASQGRLIKVNEEKIFQKVYPTPMVFSSLITGVMRFAGFDRALDIYYEMKSDGWGLDVTGLTRLLNDCLRRADWEGGLYVWGEISSINKSKVKPHDMAKAYSNMLSLCSITGNTVAFNQILNDLSRGGFDRGKILAAADKATQVARKKKQYLAPAWVADNIMIAASAYINDLRSTEPEGELAPELVDDDNTMFSQHEPEVIEDVEHNAAESDSKELWAQWLEREFGERPKEPEP
ncbi:hypothetical protein G6011_10094 [Alternaria panax]|uniref:Pentatricopeptide repeat protein n=1 Tax=Alternaria panax TaxID=48097 RepID=A0AAD4I7T0_9PLEO|nr:hypothetical protein G6011_10094 [Alternaria panax]